MIVLEYFVPNCLLRTEDYGLTLHFSHITVLLDAPDTVLIERVMGKRIDAQTGGQWRHSPRPAGSIM